MELLVLVDQLVFELSDLHFDHFVCFLNLEVGDLGAKWLDFFPDLFNQLSPIGSFELGWACCHHLHSAALSRTSSCIYWGHLAVGLDNHLLAISSCYYLPAVVHLLSFIKAT